MPVTRHSTRHSCESLTRRVPSRHPVHSSPAELGTHPPLPEHSKPMFGSHANSYRNRISIIALRFSIQAGPSSFNFYLQQGPRGFAFESLCLCPSVNSSDPSPSRITNKLCGCMSMKFHCFITLVNMHAAIYGFTIVSGRQKSGF